MQRRRVALVKKGHAWRAQDGGIRASRDLIARLERAEIERVGKSLAADKHAPFKMKGEGERVSDVFTGTTNLVSGKYAVIENAYEFTLVPWRPVMDATWPPDQRRHAGRGRLMGFYPRTGDWDRNVIALFEAPADIPVARPSQPC